MTTVLVLGGGPDAERNVSINSAHEVARALGDRYKVVERTVDRPSLEDVRDMPGDVIFPATHGRWGEGGPLQDILEADGRPYVGSGPRAARTAMDKVATLHVAVELDIPATPTAIFDPRDDRPPMDLPIVIKPVHDGSSVGLYICRNDNEWKIALREIRDEASLASHRVSMIEPYLPGRELTVGLINNRPLPTVSIEAASGVYDYEAKYHRDDTQYMVNPDLPDGVDQQIKTNAIRLAAAIGVRHVARVDYILPEAGPYCGVPQLLEINTMPGFTTHSLVPMAARAVGVEMAELCGTLIDLALSEHAAKR